jgi:GNAT superfamily N-acetyltransferase
LLIANNEVLRSVDVTIHVLRVDGEDAGYFELDWKPDDSGVIKNVELLYFGLVPAFIGKKIGPWFLNQALQLIRSKVPQARIWVHTCSWDHPKAYSTYERAGFKWFKEEVEPVTIPDWFKNQSQPIAPSIAN